MISEEYIDKLAERLVNRIEKANEYILKKMGESVKKIGTLSPSQAHEIVQILKYGGDFEKIVQYLAKVTELNVKDINKIFEEVAKKDYAFAGKFYKYNKVKYIPYAHNEVLKQQVEALRNITAETFLNFSNTTSLGYGMIDKETGKITYKGLKETYFDLIDEAVLNVGQGKESFNSAMYRQLKTIGGGGLRVIYPTTYMTTNSKGEPVVVNRSMRADSAVRMNMKKGLTDLHNQLQEIVGEQFGADGVEISVHNNPADDHAKAQGRQFSKDEYRKLQEDGVAKDYTNEEINLHTNEKSFFRPIGEYNCYHYIFSIVLGVSKPVYSKEQLNNILKENNKKFTFEGKEYTKYEGTQLQRKIELEIRKQKDQQILGRASGNDDLVRSSQDNITILTDKYRELSKISGLSTKMERMRVSGYRRVKI